MKSRFAIAALVPLVAFVPAPCLAQAPSSASAAAIDHAAHTRAAGGRIPTLPGNDAYGSIGEIVRILDADSTTDWSRVDLERLRQHLIAMNEVTLNSSIVVSELDGGARFDVTGAGRTVGAIRQMIRAHTRMLNQTAGLRAEAAEIADGGRLTVTALDPNDRKQIARIRALGFIGLFTLGEHHGPHHLSLARGAAPAGHDMSRP